MKFNEKSKIYTGYSDNFKITANQLFFYFYLIECFFTLSSNHYEKRFKDRKGF